MLEDNVIDFKIPDEGRWLVDLTDGIVKFIPEESFLELQLQFVILLKTSIKM